MAESHSHPTGLAKWLNLNRVKAGQLARELGVSPHAIAHLRDGSTASVSKAILTAVACRTQLSYEAILNPAEIVENPVATGDFRIDRCLGSIGKYLHSPEMRDKCRRYFSADFLCNGTIYQRHNTAPIGFDRMCALNCKQVTHISTNVISTSWYTPRMETPISSRILHVYWRAVRSVPSINEPNEPSTEYNDTFTVFEFEQSIGEMSPLDIPKISSWWWDQPAQYNDMPQERYPTRFHQEIYAEATGESENGSDSPVCAWAGRQGR